MIRLIAVDTALFAALLLTFAYFHHVRPKTFTPVDLSVPTAGAVTTRQPAYTPAPEERLPGEDSAQSVSSREPAATPEAAGEDTPSPTTYSDPNDPLEGEYQNLFSASGASEWTEDGYRSRKVSVTIQHVQENGVAYSVADIYIRDVQCFRSAVAQEHDRSLSRASVLEMSRWNDAVVAISGDYFGFRSNGVVAVRNGREWLKTPPLTSDILVMYYDGTMETYYAADHVDLDSIYNRGVYQIWCFGPVLVDNGEAPADYNSTVGSKNPRSAIGYYRPGHYCFVVVDGRQDGYSAGMDLEEMTELFISLGCKTAYNLDGGDTAAMVFQDEICSHPDGEPRDVSDILYIGEPVGEN